MLFGYSLILHQVVIDTPLGHELVVRALLGYPTAVHHNDVVGVAHGTEPMAYNDKRMLEVSAENPLHDFVFGLAVECAGSMLGTARQLGQTLGATLVALIFRFTMGEDQFPTCLLFAMAFALSSMLLSMMRMPHHTKA